MRTQYNTFAEPFQVWHPKEIRRIRKSLGKTTAEFAEMFIVSEDLVKQWEAREGTARHREVYGPAARLMPIVAQMAAGKTANLIRLASSGRLDR